MKKSTWREQRVTIGQQSVREINFQDTQPNHIYFANNSAYNIYVSISPLVSDSIFDMIIPPYATKLFARDEGTHQIYGANTSSLGDAAITVTSFYADFDPKNLPQTQEIVGASAAGLLGVIDVNQLMTSLPAGSNKIGYVGISDQLPAGTNDIGFVKLGASLPSGTNHIGNVKIDAGAAKIGLVVPAADPADNGSKIHRLIAAATINATVVKGSAGTLSGLILTNDGSAKAYMKVYDKATEPDPADDTPIMTIALAAGETVNMQLTIPVYCSEGISYVITGGLADTDTASVTANSVIVNTIYC